MKTITIISYPRTGTSWLVHALGGRYTFPTTEVFCSNPLEHYYNFLFLMKIHKYDTHIIDLFKKIYHPSNFDKDPVIDKISSRGKIYSLQLLQSLQSEAYSSGRNCVFKIFTEHITSSSLAYTSPQPLILNQISIEQLFHLSDLIIFNYRNDLLGTFISNIKCLISDRWNSENTDKKYLEKIDWSLIKYNKYLEQTIPHIDTLIEWSSRQTCSKNLSMIYEHIHRFSTHVEKVAYIKQRLMNLDDQLQWNFNWDYLYVKENYVANIQDNFTNPEEFIADLPLIRRYYHNTEHLNYMN